MWLFQQAGARGGPGLHGPPARRRGRLRDPWNLDADGEQRQRINNRTERGGRGEVDARWLVREGGRRTHRSWEEVAGREQVRTGGSGAVPEGREERAVRGQQAREQQGSRTGEKEGEARVRSGGGAERGRTRRGGD